MPSLCAVNSSGIAWELMPNLAAGADGLPMMLGRSRVPQKGPEIWSISAVDPMRLLAAFAPLRLKKGFAILDGSRPCLPHVWSISASAVRRDVSSGCMMKRGRRSSTSAGSSVSAVSELVSMVSGMNTPRTWKA